jgi:predicted phosphodiesterase
MEEKQKKSQKWWSEVLDYCRKHTALTAVSGALALLPALILFATWSLTSDKMYNTATCMPALVGVGVWIAFAAWVVNHLCVRRKWLSVLVCVWGAVSALGIVVMLAAALSKLTYLGMAGAPYFAAAVLVLAIVLLWCGGIKLNKKAYRVGCIIMTIVVALVIVLGVFNLQPVYFNAGAVVFAIEDEYQICWSTSTTTTGYVQVGETVYTDADAGSLHVSRIHKVCVPREALEQAKAYTVVSTGVTLARAYLTVHTGEVRRTYAFRPVDASDGLQIYNISDNHLYTSGAIKAGGYWGDRLDVLIANGDHLNDVSAEWQITNMYRMLSGVTGGERPIIISRGNHEAVGATLDLLPRYFASREGTFYYTVRLGDCLFVVLDLANDMADDNKVISTLADFDGYRERELEWLRALRDSRVQDDPTIKHVVAVCHIAFPLNLSRYNGETSTEMMHILEEMGTEIMLSGHSHRVQYYPADEGDNAAAFPVVLGSLRSDDYTDREGLGGAHFTGMAVEIADGGIEVRFTNSRGEVKDAIR